MPQNRSSDSDLAAAVEHLARTAALARTFGMQKSAMPSMQDIGNFVAEQKQKLQGYAQQAGQAMSQNPVATGIGAGAIGGGLLGLGSSMTEDKERRRPMRSMLTGALAGAAAGGGLGLLHREAPTAFGPAPESGSALKKYRDLVGANTSELWGSLPSPGPATTVGTGTAAYQVGNEIGAGLAGRSAYDSTAMRQSLEQALNDGKGFAGGLSKEQLKSLAAAHPSTMQDLLYGNAAKQQRAWQQLQPPRSVPRGPAPSMPANLVRDLESAMWTQRPKALKDSFARGFLNRPSIGPLKRFPRVLGYPLAVGGGWGIDQATNSLRNLIAARTAKRQALEAAARGVQ